MRGIKWLGASIMTAMTTACSVSDNAAANRDYFYDGATIVAPPEHPNGFVVIPGLAPGQYIVLGPNKDRAPGRYRNLYAQ